MAVHSFVRELDFGFFDQLGLRAKTAYFKTFKNEFLGSSSLHLLNVFNKSNVLSCQSGFFCFYVISQPDMNLEWRLGRCP